MKKIIASVAALSMCALMLTACGGNNSTGDSGLTEDITTSAAAEDNGAADAETKAEEPADASDETEAETEAEASDDGADPSEAAASYASLEEFIKADDVFTREGELVDGKKSNTYNFVTGLDTKNGNGFYMDIEAADGSMKMTMAATADNIAANVSGDDGAMSIIINIADKIMYMLEPTSKIALYMELDDAMLADYTEQYNAQEILGNSLDLDSDVEGVESYKVEIAGETYTFEKLDEVGFLFDKSGKLHTIVSNGADDDTPAFIINEFSLNIPSGSFDIPSDYEQMSMEDVAALFQ